MVAYSDLWDQTFNLHWLGVPITKTPADMIALQEIVVETEPTLIVETGVMSGGSALLFASILDLLGTGGRVIGIDVDLDGVAAKVRDHPRIELLEGSSTDPKIVEHVRAAAEGQRVMVDLDSDHSADHVLEELRLLSPLVSEGCYLVVEDSFITIPSNHPAYPPNPLDAIETWFDRDRPPFEVDRWRERFLITTNPLGFLRRTTESGGSNNSWKPRECVVGELEDPPPNPVLTRADTAEPDQLTPGPTAKRDATARYGAEPEQLWTALAEERSRANHLQEDLETITSSRGYRWYATLRALPGLRRIGPPPRP